MAAFNPDYNPGKVMLNSGKDNSGALFGAPQSIGPYMNTGRAADPRITKKPPAQNAPAPAGNVLGPETVRATGGGPFDSAYRQNLATYAGGQMQRPGGNLNFNPTSSTPFGNPNSGGTDPITGGPNSLTAMALGGEGFQYTAPKPPTPKKGSNMQPEWQDWLSNRSRYGKGI